jgi:hypothetical protein
VAEAEKDKRLTAAESGPLLFSVSYAYPFWRFGNTPSRLKAGIPVRVAVPYAAGACQRSVAATRLYRASSEVVVRVHFG